MYTFILFKNIYYYIILKYVLYLDTYQYICMQTGRVKYALRWYIILLSFSSYINIYYNNICFR